MKILVTGGAGFIGSNFLRLYVPEYPNHAFINLDKLTYAANLYNLKDISDAKNYFFVQADIADFESVKTVLTALSLTSWCTLRQKAMWIEASLGLQSL